MNSTFFLWHQAVDDPYSDLHHEAFLNVTVTISDINDSPPVFKKKVYQPLVSENAGIHQEFFWKNYFAL